MPTINLGDPEFPVINVTKNYLVNLLKIEENKKFQDIEFLTSKNPSIGIGILNGVIDSTWIIDNIGINENNGHVGFDLYTTTIYSQSGNLFRSTYEDLITNLYNDHKVAHIIITGFKPVIEGYEEFIEWVNSVNLTIKPNASQIYPSEVNEENINIYIDGIPKNIDQYNVTISEIIPNDDDGSLIVKISFSFLILGKNYENISIDREFNLLGFMSSSNNNSNNNNSSSNGDTNNSNKTSIKELIIYGILLIIGGISLIGIVAWMFYKNKKNKEENSDDNYYDDYNNQY